MNRKGFMVLEFIFGFIVSTIVFVILSTMLYQLVKVDGSSNDKLNIDAFIMKVERDLWYVSHKNINVTTKTLTYTRGLTRYVFYHEGDKLKMAIGPNGREEVHIWIDGVIALSFYPCSDGILVHWTNRVGEMNESIIFYSWH